MIRILIVDDSATDRLALRLAFENDPEIRVVGEASDGDMAMRRILAEKPDLVTMDVHLSRHDGIEVAARLMQEAPLPILVVTGADTGDPELVYRAMEAGALDVWPKLPSPRHPDYPRHRGELLRLVKALSRVPVVHRFARRRTSSSPGVAPRPVLPVHGPPRLVVLGASTGGPPVLAEVLRRLAAPLPIPVAVVQHMARGFIDGFAGWLGPASGHRVEVVRRPLAAEAGVVYLAPDDRHLHLVAPDRLAPVDAPPRAFQKPSVDELFESAARQLGPRAAAVLFTGMGSDGAAGMCRLREAGALTIAQEPQTCVVDGMPRSAIDAGGAERILEPSRVARALQEAIPGAVLVRSRAT